MSKLSRRKLLGASVAAGIGGLSSGLLGCGNPIRSVANRALLRTPAAAEPGRVVLDWSVGERPDEPCRRSIERLGGLPWLSRGDSVLLKVASNSSNEHPAVTWPEAVPAFVRLLRDAGAGRVLVGDQAGVEHVRLTADHRSGSSREVMVENGLAEAAARAGAELVCFEERGWDGYLRVEPDFESHWGAELWLARAVEEVDHVVYLPRLGAHALAGVTLGAKSAVGWLRDDSRLHLHRRGDAFFELFAEVNHARPLRDRLRLVFTMGPSALLDIGPDFGTVVDLEATVVVASRSLLAHDLVATALLVWLDERESSLFDPAQPFPENADFFNRKLVLETWGEQAASRYRHLVPGPLGRGLAYDRALSRLAVLEGARPARIVVERDGQGHPDGLMASLRADPDGLVVV